MNHEPTSGRQGSVTDDEPEIDWVGGYMRLWSTFSPEVQEIIRADLLATAEDDIEAWRESRGW